MVNRSFDELIWREIVWQRPFELDAVQEMLVHLASLTTRGPIVWETRCNGQRTYYLLGMEQCHQSKIKQAIEPHGKIQFRKAEEERKPVNTVEQLKMSKIAIALKTDNAIAVVRAGLAAMNQCRDHEELVLQITLGPAITPSLLPPNMPDPHASWLATALGNVGPASPDSRSAVKEKISLHGFNCVIRLGASAGVSTVGAHARINGLFAALRTLESAGVRLNLKSEEPAKLNDTYVPWSFPLQLSVKELAHFLLLPVGEEDLPGTPGLHPKLCLPPAWYRQPDRPENDRSFAVAMDGTRLNISPADSLLQTHVLGPIGSGKSTLMLHQIMKDIDSGRGVLVLDPKNDLISDIITRIPEHRDKDVVIIDPSDPAPVGFNPFSYKESPTLVADAILSVFKEVFSENWGILSQDVMSAALLTLAQVPGASLLWLPRMLTDDVFRKNVTSQISDKIGLDSYWAGFDAMKDGERRKEIAPVLNKLRQFILRPGLRNVLGQSNPKFDLADLFNKKRIVLVPLNKGVIGSESARLLGSLLVSMLWTIALSRANIPQAQRHIVSVYIDELQDYLALPTNLSSALAQARGMGLSLVLSHQYREQLPPDIRAGIDANCLNKIVFSLNVGDAKAMAAMAPELEPVDFMSLPRYQIYTSFQSSGKATGWVQGKTLPPPTATRLAADLRAKSMTTYGRPIEEIEREYLEQLGHTTGEPPCQPADTVIEHSEATSVGRKKKDPA